MPRAKNVDEYIASAPPKCRSMLKQLRTAIRKSAPEAHEKISYGIPYYGYKGRLAYFRLSTNHLGLYIPPPVIADHARELKTYPTATATIRFSLNKKLPLALIKKLIKARMILNEALKQR